jgi:hypothetical protein
MDGEVPDQQKHDDVRTDYVDRACRAVSSARADDQRQAARQQQHEGQRERATEQSQPDGRLAALRVPSGPSVVARHPVADARQLQQDRSEQGEPDGHVEGDDAPRPEHDGHDLDQHQWQDEGR